MSLSSPARPASLAMRVTIFVGIATTLCLISLGAFVQQAIETHFLQQDTSELQVVAEAVRTALASDASGSDLPHHLESAVSGHHAIYFLVANAEDEVIYATPGADLSTIATSLPRIQFIESTNVSTWMANNTTYRGAVLDLPAPAPGLNQNVSRAATLVVATSIDFHLEFMSDFYRTLWGIVIGISLLSIFAAWLAVQRGHSPLRLVSNQIRDIGSDRLHLRVDTTQVPIELVDLVSAFNDMLKRMEDVFNRLSNFSADIAHELRTPITNIITQTQVSLNQLRNVDEYREILYSNLEEYERMASMINDMLILAKTESGLLEPSFTEINVKEEVQELFEFFEAWSEENQVMLELSGDCANVTGDRSMLKRALSNLLTNAIRHSAKDESVRVILATAAAGSTISIENTGTVIPADQISRIFDRFYRGDPSRQRRGDGAGLGLAIVKSITDVHGWSIAVESKDGVTRFDLGLRRH